MSEDNTDYLNSLINKVINQNNQILEEKTRFENKSFQLFNISLLLMGLTVTGFSFCLGLNQSQSQGGLPIGNTFIPWLILFTFVLLGISCLFSLIILYSKEYTFLNYNKFIKKHNIMDKEDFLKNLLSTILHITDENNSIFKNKTRFFVIQIGLFFLGILSEFLAIVSIVLYLIS